MSGELQADRTIRKFRIVAREATRDVERLAPYPVMDACLGYALTCKPSLQVGGTTMT